LKLGGITVIMILAGSLSRKSAWGMAQGFKAIQTGIRSSFYHADYMGSEQVSYIRTIGEGALVLSVTL
jgi:hypothetical protein